MRTTSTLLSGSSYQSTGTSWIRRPQRSASTSSSVSKNHAGSSTIGSSSAATSARIALNPHWASVNRAPRLARSSTLYARLITSRRAPRTTREPWASRLPMARSECPDISGATSGQRPSRSVDRSTSMYARIGASERDHTALSARPRPFSSRWTARTPGSCSARWVATAQVPSVLALSATVMRNG